jgi:SAM-dependent methyltransferase
MLTTFPLIDRTRDMDERSWWDYWNRSYRSQDDDGEVPSELFERTAATINKLIQLEGGRVLEIACGAGALSRRLNYSSYHGLDISPAAIEIARQKSEQIQRPSDTLSIYEAADFHDWTALPETFDVAVCVDAIAYFRDQPGALKKMSQSLRASGVLVLTTINPFVYRRIRRTSRSPLREGSVSRWLSRNELHNLIDSAGLTTERSFTIMPRGNLGILRLLNARRVSQAFGPNSAAAFNRWKEQVGVGQYRVVVARKDVHTDAAS